MSVSPHQSTDRRRIYLDNAATSWPKPPGVREAVLRALDLGVSNGRGQSAASAEVGRTLARLRRSAAALFGCGDAGRVVFTNGGTDGLNLVLRGYLKAGRRVVTTAGEHNSVERPLHATGGLLVDRIAVLPDGTLDPSAVETLLAQPADLLVMTHASNVTGTIHDVAAVSHAAKAAGAVVVLDACQTAGHVAVSFASLSEVDVIVASGHKGLGGPLGTGLVAFREGLDRLPEPLRYGGTGSGSESDAQPDAMPGRYEAGSLNVPGLFGLEAALSNIADRLDAPTPVERLIDGLATIPAVRVIGPPAGSPRTPVVSVTVDGWQPHDFAAVLESEFGIETRAGLHCAPRMHRSIGTFDSGGTVRFSPSAASSVEDVDAAIEACRTLVGA